MMPVDAEPANNMRLMTVPCTSDFLEPQNMAVILSAVLNRSKRAMNQIRLMTTTNNTNI